MGTDYDMSRHCIATGGIHFSHKVKDLGACTDLMIRGEFLTQKKVFELIFSSQESSFLFQLVEKASPLTPGFILLMMMQAQ